MTVKEENAGEGIANSHHPDLIISDISMPGKSGLDVLQSLRARGLRRKSSWAIRLAKHSVSSFTTHLQVVSCGSSSRA